MHTNENENHRIERRQGRNLREENKKTNRYHKLRKRAREWAGGAPHAGVSRM